MSDQFWLTPTQLNRIKPHFPLSHGIPRVDDLRVVSGIMHVIRNGFRWRDAPLADGVGFEPTKPLPVCRFSRPVPSTTRAPIRTYNAKS